MNITAIGLATAIIGAAMLCFDVPDQIGWTQSWLLLAFIAAIIFYALPSHVARLERDAAEYENNEYEP